MTRVKRVCQPANGGEQTQPIRESDLLKGYEISKGEYVVLDEQELRSIAPKTSTEMQIVEFVRFNEVDPIYLESSYYFAPGEEYDFSGIQCPVIRPDHVIRGAGM